MVLNIKTKKAFPFSQLARCLILACLTSISVKVMAEAIDYPPVEPNVPYSSVAKLTYQEADKKIQYGDDALQYALLWKAKPAGINSNKPLIVLIHGGCWLNAFDIKHTFPLSSALAQAGYDIWSLEYRRTGDEGGGWPGTFEDIQQGILAAKRYSQEYKLDNIIVAGHSAGGHLALLAGSELPKLKGVIGLAAIADIEKYSKGTNSCQTVTKDFMQGTVEEKPDAYALANPVKRKSHHNSTLLQGDADTIVPQSQAFDSGLKTTLIKQAGHFDWIHPGSAAFKSLIQTIETINK